MRLVTRKPLESLQQLPIDPAGAELLDELIIVDGKLLAVFGDAALDIPGSDDLSVRLVVGNRLDRERVGRRGLCFGWSCCFLVMRLDRICRSVPGVQDQQYVWRVSDALRTRSETHWRSLRSLREQLWGQWGQQTSRLGQRRAERRKTCRGGWRSNFWVGGRAKQILTRSTQSRR